MVSLLSCDSCPKPEWAIREATMSLQYALLPTDAWVRMVTFGKIMYAGTPPPPRGVFPTDQEILQVRKRAERFPDLGQHFLVGVGACVATHGNAGLCCRPGPGVIFLPELQQLRHSLGR